MFFHAALIVAAYAFIKKCQALFELLLVDNYESFKLTFDEERRSEHNELRHNSPGLTFSNYV